jgi:hypothetical protein
VIGYNTIGYNKIATSESNTMCGSHTLQSSHTYQTGGFQFLQTSIIYKFSWGTESCDSNNQQEEEEDEQ